MNRFYVFHVCLAIFGAIFLASAAATLVAGAWSLPVVVQATSGLVVVGTSVYTLRTRSPSEFDTGNLAFWAVVVGTAGIVLVQILEFV